MREENGIKILEVGDVIFCGGIRAEIASIAYQEYWDREGFRTEFTDTKGNYRSWKQVWDGGFVLNHTPVPAEVVEHVKEYLAAELSEYELVEVLRASEHPEDDYLYMVIAKGKCWYSVWTCWNEKTHVLNYGHYGIESHEKARTIAAEYYHKIKRR